MASFAYIWWMFFKVVFVFVMLYIFIPSKIIRFEDESRGLLDKLFISLTNMVFITIIAVHILVFLKIYETFSLLFVYIAIYVFVYLVRGKSWMAVTEAMGMRFVATLLDISDGRMGFFNEASRRLKAALNSKVISAASFAKESVREPIRALSLIVLFYAVYLRFNHSIAHSTFTASDPYLHLAWTKYLGMNEIYYQGIYPYGYQTVISSMSKLFFIDPYWLIRFVGPLGGVLLALSVYYLSLRITRNHIASFLTLVIYGTVINEKLPTVFIRQTAALPQEFAAIFIFPALYFLWLYFEKNKLYYLILFAEALSITILIHPFSTIYIFIWSVILTIILMITKRPRLKVVFKFFSISTVFSIIGLAPMGMGILMGKEFFKSSADFIVANLKLASSNYNILALLTKIVSGNHFLDIALFAMLLIILNTIISLSLKKANTQLTFEFAVMTCTFVTMLLYRSHEFNLPNITHPARTGIFLSPMLCILYSCGYNSIQRTASIICGESMIAVQKLSFRLLSILMCIFIFYNNPPQRMTTDVMEYDAAANAYLSIKANFPVYDWTIIAPTEQFQQVLGNGWHYEILRFVQEYNVEDVEDPDFKLPIPTHHVFIFTEKVPLHLGRKITYLDAEKELEPEGDDPFAQYYHTGEQRGILQAKAIKLIEAYTKTHSGVNIYYEDENMKIYHIYHEIPEDLAESGAS
jgi:hypothetical protein